MNRFAYRAMTAGVGHGGASPDGAGQIVRGLLEAPDRLQLQQLLHRQGLVLLSARRRWLSLAMPWQKLDRAELASFFERAAMLMTAGIPLLDALAKSETMVRQRRLRHVLKQLRMELLAGQSLGQAVSTLPHGGFGALATSLFQAADQTGQLAGCFDRLAAHYRWHLSWKQQNWQAMRYPLMVIGVVLMLLSMISQQLLPGLSGLLQSLGSQPSLAAKLLMQFSGAVGRFGGAVLIVLVGLSVAVVIAAISLPRVRTVVDRVRLKLPLLGELHRDGQIIPYTHAWLLAWQAGVPLLRGLELARAALSNRSLVEQAKRLEQQLADGQSLSIALMGSRLLPPLLQDLVLMGEQTGRLDHCLQQGLTLLERQLAITWPRRWSQLQNGLLLVAGGMILWVLAAMMLPVYQAVGQLGKGF
jgi:type IV pilus assembly protein PilC